MNPGLSRALRACCRMTPSARGRARKASGEEGRRRRYDGEYRRGGPTKHHASVAGRSQAVILQYALMAAALVVLTAGSGSGGEPPPPTVDELFRYLGFEPKAKKDLLGGKVIAADFREGTDKELAITVAALFPVPLREVFEMARAGKSLEA